MKEPKWIAPIPPPWVEPYAVVWVDVAKLEASWRQTLDYVGVGGTGAAIKGRYEKLGQWFALGQLVEIPSVVLDGGEISFTDGRHRFAWFRDHGVTIMPVHVEPETAGVIKSRFGANVGPDWQPVDVGDGEK